MSGTEEGRGGMLDWRGSGFGAQILGILWVKEEIGAVVASVLGTSRVRFGRMSMAVIISDV